MPKPLKIALKVLSIMLISVMAIILLSNVYLLIKREVSGNKNATVLGFTSAVVLTGSMENTISPNDMVIVHRQDDYAVNDIVMYKGGTLPVTHRIIEEKENGYITKGDANNTDDGEIPKELVIGKVVLIVPSVGVVLTFLQSPLGMLILLLILFLMIELPNIFENKRKNKRQT